MLTISRFESAGEDQSLALKANSFECEECVKDVLDRLAPVIEEKQARAILEFPAGGSRIAGDRFYWDQVFFNLIENALKENQRPGLEIRVSMERRPDHVILRVADNGIGIPRADLPFIFKRFYRVAKHHSQQEIKGTGLGLSIVKRAIEAHGGTICVESVPGQKTEFTITLPPDIPPPLQATAEMNSGSFSD
jgi:signal transduction histidine kinase